MEYTIIKSNRRTLALEIKNGKFIVRTPIRATDDEINEFVTKHRKWIEKNFSKIAERKNKLKNIEPLSRSDIQALADKAVMVIPDRVRYYAEKIGVTYGRMEYIKEIRKNPIAKAVKLADLKHNSDLSRLDTVDDKARKRAEKYEQAIDILIK